MTFSSLYLIGLNSIYYNALNDIRYLSEIGFKDQIQNSQKMVFLILGHPVCSNLVLVFFGGRGLNVFVDNYLYIWKALH